MQYKSKWYTVIATALEKTRTLLKELDADSIFDYEAPGICTNIHAYTDGKLKYAFNCISELAGGTLRKASVSPNSSGSTMSMILSYQPLGNLKEVQIKFSLACALTGLVCTKPPLKILLNCACVTCHIFPIVIAKRRMCHLCPNIMKFAGCMPSHCHS
jgi:hypothetical protein